MLVQMFSAKSGWGDVDATIDHGNIGIAGAGVSLSPGLSRLRPKRVAGLAAFPIHSPQVPADEFRVIRCRKRLNK